MKEKHFVSKIQKSEKSKKEKKGPPRGTSRDGSKKNEIIQEVVQQLRSKKKTLDPWGRTPPFRRLTCLTKLFFCENCSPKKQNEHFQQERVNNSVFAK